MSRILIVEGQRASGKTTIAKELCGKIGYEYTKFERGFAPSVDMPLQILSLFLKRKKVVIDRFHLSEFVMRAYDRKVPFWYLAISTHFIAFLLRAVNAATIIVGASDIEIERRLSERASTLRTADISSYIARPMWVTASIIFHCSIFPNETDEQKQRIVDWMTLLAGE